jgi:signal transduction histidine kinase
MGYQRVDWIKEPREFDLVAELPKKDPDGFEYRELWLVAMGRHAPPQMLLEMASHEPDFFLHRFLRDEERLERLTSRGYGDVPITLLVILLKGEYPGELLEGVHSRVSRRAGRGPLGLSLRLRVWDRKYLTSLVQQFPQIGYKYFSDEGRSLSKYRKSPDELYQETIALNERLAATVAALEDEKNRRVRAERDAIWKDVSFSAAHKIGNPIFAIETNLDPLKKRIVESRTGEAMEVAASIAVSVEKAKAIIDQFKSLTRAQQITPVQTLLRPVLEDACRMARNQGVTCEIECPADVTVRADPDRLTECFDELASNAMNWFDKPEKKIAVQVVQPAPQPLPESVDSSQQYTLIDFRDTGAGVPVGNKSRIFDAFVTTRDHGTGLGLAVVRRIIEGHGGVICESGTPGQGAHFEIYLPVAGEALAGATRSPNHKE